MRNNPFFVAVEHHCALKFCTEVPKAVLTSVRKSRWCTVLSAGRLAQSVRKGGFSSSDAVCKSVCAIPEKVLREAQGFSSSSLEFLSGWLVPYSRLKERSIVTSWDILICAGGKNRLYNLVSSSLCLYACLSFLLWLLFLSVTFYCV